MSIINNPTFLMFAKQIDPKELMLNNVNITDNSCQFLDLDISLFKGKLNIHTYLYKKDNVSFSYCQFSFFWGMVMFLWPNHIGIYISQLVCFALTYICTFEIMFLTSIMVIS